MLDIIFSILLVLIGIFIGIVIIFVASHIKKNSATKKADDIINNAKDEAEKIKRDSVLEAKEEAYKIKADAEKLLRESKAEIKVSEDRLLTRESNIDRRDLMLQNREQLLDDKENNILLKQKEIQEEQVKVEDLKKKQMEELESISGFSREEAKDAVLSRVQDMMDVEINAYIKDREAEAKLEADKKAKSLVVSCMQRYAADVASEQTVTVVNLPNDEMKGRIIGREGRNIRTIEAVTGVDLIIDDTPEAIVLSSFDPLRREIAKVTIETLIKDGRIHPTRIEELYDKVSSDMNIQIREYGEAAIFDLGITKVDPELVELIGKLHFRTSYGQNVLKHSIEVAALTGLLAAELGENVILARRAGLLHDIGKAIDHEVEGSHVTIGADIARRFKEHDVVINAIESHHGDHDATSVIAVLVAVADALSASRPGARNDSLENYIKRLQDLESVANDIAGVE